MVERISGRGPPDVEISPTTRRFEVFEARPQPDVGRIGLLRCMPTGLEVSKRELARRATLPLHQARLSARWPKSRPSSQRAEEVPHVAGEQVRCLMAAKWPPRSNSDQCTMLLAAPQNAGSDVLGEDRHPGRHREGVGQLLECVLS